MVINSPTDSPFSELDLIGVAVCQYPNEQNHIAVLYKPDSDEDETLLLHVGDHKAPLIGTPNDKYLWLDLGSSLPTIRKELILVDIQIIAEVNKDAEIRYGLDHGIFCLDAATGRLNANYDQTIGFTCATFVIEVFLASGIQLIDWETWPVNESQHIAFQKRVFNYLKSLYPQKVTLEYLKAQESNIGGSRFLPQEIAASTQEARTSIKSDIDARSAEIHARLCENYAHMNS
jgi:hypothetical protein